MRGGGGSVRRSIWSWAGGRQSRGEKAQSERLPGLEPLEPRLLLSADLIGTPPLTTLDTGVNQQAIFVDLQEQNNQPETSQPAIFTLELAPFTEAATPEQVGDATGDAGSSIQTEPDRVSLGVQMAPVADSSSIETELGTNSLPSPSRPGSTEYDIETGLSDSAILSPTEPAGPRVTDQQIDGMSSSETRPIEIRGPPDDGSCFTSTLSGNPYTLESESSGLTIGLDAPVRAGLQAPDLAGLHLIDPDPSNFAGQMMYLDMGAGSNHIIFLRLDTADDDIETLQITDGAGTVLAEALLADTTSICIHGQEDVDDTLVVDLSGAPIPIPITYDGGAGGLDTLVIQGGQFATANYTADGPDAGTIVLDQTTIHYLGLEPITDNSAVDERVFADTTGTGQQIRLCDDDNPTNGFSRIDSNGTGGFESITFRNPATSLTILAGEGNDTITVDALDTGFAAALVVCGEQGSDAIEVTHNLTLPGQGLVLVAETITVYTGVVIDTRHVDGLGETDADSGSIELGSYTPVSGDPVIEGKTITLNAGVRLLAGVDPDSGFAAGDITLTAEDNAVRQVMTISPFDYTAKTATITIASGVVIDGGNVSITSTAKDTNIYDDLGAYSDKAIATLLGLLDQIPGLGISAIFGVSGQVIIRHADATISLTDATITSSGSVTVASSASSDASLHVVSVSGLGVAGAWAISVGYGEAYATAESTLNGSTQIIANDGVDVTSSAVTAAYVKARTTANLGIGASQPNYLSLAAAIANTNETSHVTLAQNSSIQSLNGSVSLDASGKVTNFAWSTPTVNEEGTAVIAFGLAYDKADIKVQVDGTIDAAGSDPGSGGEFSARPGDGEIDYATDIITIVDHGFVNWEEVVYSHGEVILPLGTGEPPDIGGLEEGGTYYVQVIDKDHIRLFTTPAIDLDYTDLGYVATQTLSRLGLWNFDSTLVDADLDTITFAAPHNLAGGELAWYAGNPEGPVEGLVQGKAYKVQWEDAYTIKLLDPANSDAVVDITDAGEGLQALICQYDVHSFAPGTAVNSDANTITFTTPHGFVDGDLVVYYTDPSISYTKPMPPTEFTSGLSVIDSYTVGIVGDQTPLAVPAVGVLVTVGGSSMPAVVVSATYDEVANLTTVVLDQPVVADPLTRIVFPSTTVATFSDAPIGGLNDGSPYAVVVVDDYTIWLAPTQEAATAIDLTQAVDLTGTGLGEAHSLQSSGTQTGISIHAGLSASNAVCVGAVLSADPFSWTTAAQTGLGGNLEELIGGITQIAKNAMSKQPSNSPASAGTSFGFAGAVAINYAYHDVQAIVGPTAQLTSSMDIGISAGIKECSQVASTASASKPKSDNAVAAVALAVGLGIFDNTAKAIVEGGAQLDAAGTTSVASSVVYPFLIANPLTALNPLDYLKSTGPEGWAWFMDGTLGFASNLFNTFVLTSASGAKVGVGGSIAVNIYINHSEARIQSGALINQNTDSRFRAGEQAVEVTARTEMHLIGVIGVGALGFNITGGVGAVKKWATGDVLGGLTQLVNPFGAEGDKGGIGASFLVVVPTNTTEAVIEGGASVYAGAGGLTVSADTKTFEFAFAQAGGKASSFAISGAFSVAVYTNTTKAHIDSGALVDSAGDIAISATDDLVRISVTGGLVAGASIGIGVSVSVNFVDRDTQAFIGTSYDLAPGTAGTDIYAGGQITISSTSTGRLWTGALAAVVSGSPPSEKEVADNDRVKNAPSKAQKVLGESGDPSKEKIKIGVGVAGDVSVNVIVEDTYAYINDTGLIQTDGALTLSSVSDSEIWSLAGAVAIVLKGEQTSVGIAGSLSANVLTSKTVAFIAGATVQAGSVTIEARREGGIRSLTAAGSGAPLKEGIAVAGSISVNVVLDDVEAYMSGVDATVDGNCSITATNEVFIVAVGGAVGFGGRAGVGVGIAINVMGADMDPNVTKAYVDDSRITITAGTLEVSATNENPGTEQRIIAITASVGIGKGPSSVAGAGTLAVNIITNDTLAYVTNSTILETPDNPGVLNTRVAAKDTSGIVAISGAVGISKQGSIGVAISYNEIDNDVLAYFDYVNLTQSGFLTLDAQSKAIIGGVTVGVAGATSGTFAGAGSITINAITNNTDAHLANTLGTTSNIT